MKNKSWFANITNKCEVCGRMFGRHDIVKHILVDAEKHIVDLFQAHDNKEVKPQMAVPGAIRMQPMNELNIMQSVVNLSAKVDTSKKCAVEVLGTSPDFMVDFGHWLDVLGFMTYRAMKYQEWSKDKVIAHVGKELGEWIDTYEEQKRNAAQKIQK